MKKLLTACILLLIVGCEDPTEEIATESSSLSDHMKVITIDSCEYIEYSYMLGSQHGAYSLTHKGNCKYCALRK